jgi:hypothetical protein
MHTTFLGHAVAPPVFRTMLVAGIALLLFLAIPWVLVACRATGTPAWVYGGQQMVGWLRMWALLPVWLMLIAVVALVFAALRSSRDE